MADREERLGLPPEQLLEPQDAVHVEMVRGLVEQQQLGLAHELARDGQALLPAARERGHVLRGVGEAGLPHRDGEMALGLVLVAAAPRARPRAARTSTVAPGEKLGSCGT